MIEREREEILLVSAMGTVLVREATRPGHVWLGVQDPKSDLPAGESDAMVCLTEKQQQGLVDAIANLGRGHMSGNSSYDQLADSVEIAAQALEEAVDRSHEFASPESALAWALEIVRPALNEAT
ncbi:MAG: hypothetical protein KJN79_00110 [Gammaproteobacteria bacterium]|nr:hypothetical protein [Gammaproteobacteria bacterium]